MNPAPPHPPYVQAVIQLYLQLPDTPDRPRPPDRRLAAQLCDSGVPLVVIQQALLLASARRICRPTHAPALSPIRSLYYFLPVIEELLAHPLPDGYTAYLLRKLHLTSPSPHPLDPEPVQKTAFSDDR